MLVLLFIIGVILTLLIPGFGPLIMAAGFVLALLALLARER